MVISCARGIDLEVQPRRFLRGEMPQHGLRRRAAADIAQTNHQDAD
jgi:hypothetical protein